MFNELKKTIKDLNSNINDTVNCQKAQKLKKKLLSGGITTAVIGFVGSITCFIFFIIGIKDLSAEISFASPNVLIPFILFVPCGAIGGIGMIIAAFGFQITVTGYATKLINNTVTKNCPNCKENISPDAVFCPKCGEKIKKICNNCKTVNDIKNDYCIHCGEKLD